MTWLTEEQVRDIVGRRIVTVEQQRTYDDNAGWRITSQTIVLDNDVRLMLALSEET